MTQYGGVFPEEYEEVLALPGIGAYTAGAICSICFDRPTPAVDGNVLRVIARITEDWEAIEKPAMKKRVTENLAAVYPKESGTFTQSLMELGALVCIPNGEPKCEVCPVRSQCRAYANGTWKQLPVRTPKKGRRIEYKTVFVLECEDSVAVCRRPSDGLLAGMWEFPNVEGQLTVQKAAETAAVWDTQPADVTQKLIKNHIFTHVEWRMVCYYIRCRNRADRFRWVSKDAVAESVALPTAFRQFFENR